MTCSPHYLTASLSHGERSRLLVGAQAWIATLCRRAGFRGEDLEDAIQDVLAEVWRASEKYDPAEGAFTTFCRAVAGRKLAGIKRDAATHGVRTVAMSNPELVVADPVEPDDEPGDEPAAADVGPILAALGQPELLSELTSNQRRLFELVAIDGLTVVQAAQQVGVKLSLAEITLRQVAARLMESGKLPAELVERFRAWKQTDAIHPARPTRYSRGREWKPKQRPRPAEKETAPEKGPGATK